MNTLTNSPPLAYLVSAYPAISHTFILREVAQLRALGHRIVTASINRPDRAPGQMEPHERAEAEATYGVKQHGAAGALAALLFWLLHAPLALLATLRFGLRLRSGSKAWWSGLAYAVEAAMVARWMRREGARHLHVHFGNAGASVGVLVKRLTACHLSYTIHGPDEFDEVQGQHLALKMREADAVVCISQFARGQLMRITDPAQWGKFRVCRLGVEPEQFRFGLRSPGPLTRLLCVGRLTPAKGQILLVQALAQLRDAGLPFHLTLVGAGPDRARIESAIAAHGLGHAITLTGALTQNQVRQRFALADIFVLPSLAEGIPVVLMEAMSCGVPCVTTPVNGIPELVIHDQTGLLATPGDVASLAARLRQLIEQPALRRSLALAARDKVRRDFDLNRNVAALGGIFAAFPRAD
jgi:colanic acid/amylovoran biosynthesis glycosyltransferase